MESETAEINRVVSQRWKVRTFGDSVRGTKKAGSLNLASF